MIKKLITHTAIYGLAPYIPKLFSFFTLPIITKDLTTLDYGVAGVVGAYVAALGVFNTLGLRLILVNSFYHYSQQYKWAWRQIYGFLSLWVIVFALIVSVLLYFVIPGEAQDNAVVIILLNTVPLICFGPVSMIGSTYYQLKQQPTQIAGRTVVLGLLTIVLNLYTITVLKLGYMGWFITDAVVGVISNASYWYPVNVTLKLKPIFNFKWRLIRKALKVSLPTVPHYYSTYLLNTSDRVILSFFKTPTAEIGKYNLASNFGNYFSSIANASGLAVGPMLNKLYKQGNEDGARALIFTLQAGFFLGTSLTCLWMKELFYFLIRNETLREMYPLAIIIVMSYNYRPMYFGANAKLMYVEKTKVLWRVTFVAGVINVALNMIFIPVFGIMASAVITFISYLYMGYSGYFFKIFKQHNTIHYYPVQWMLATILLCIGVYFLVQVNWAIKVCISGLALGSLIIIYRRYRHLISHE